MRAASLRIFSLSMAHMMNPTCRVVKTATVVAYLPVAEYAIFCQPQVFWGIL